MPHAWKGSLCALVWSWGFGVRLPGLDPYLALFLTIPLSRLSWNLCFLICKMRIFIEPSPGIVVWIK